MAEICLLLGAAQALPLLRLGLLFTLFSLGLGAGFGALGLTLGNALGFALLECSSFCLGLRFGLGSLLCLFALDLGVLSSVPRV